MQPSHDPPAARPRRVRYTLTATLLEDAQLGSGLGGSGLNSLVARDRERRPVIWASHLEGLLRDVARLRRQGSFADELLGKAGGDRQLAQFTSLYCTSPEPSASRVWRSTARASFENRAPKGESLRSVEMVARDTTFRGTVELPEDATLVQALRSWLRELDAVGHGRAAGAGRVRFTLVDATDAPRSIVHASGSSHLRLLLRNLEPLCLAATTTPSNLIPSLPYVPGRALLGAITSWLLQDEQRELAALVTSEQLSFGDALPLPWTDVDSIDELDVLPAPLALRHSKPESISGDLPWWTRQEPPPLRRFEDPIEGEKLPMGPRTKGPASDLFVARRGSESWQAFRPTLQTRMRNGRPDPRRASPMLFAIEQIAERSLFLSDLFGPPALLARLVEGLRPLLEGRAWLRVGRAGAPVEIAALGNRRPAAPALDEGELVLTSDLLVRDEQLRWHTSVPEERDLKPFLERAGLPRALRMRSIAQDATIIRGFNGTSRLWRLPLGGIRRGSVFRISGEGVRELALAAAEGRWLGERVHEGCGRFRIDPKRMIPGVTSGPSSSARARQSGADDDPAEQICKLTKHWCESYVAKISHRSPSPSLSQWMDLVVALERKDGDALSIRQAAGTRGAIAWEAPPAREILSSLGRLSEEDRGAHARLFVRWLRASQQGATRS